MLVIFVENIFWVVHLKTKYCIIIFFYYRIKKKVSWEFEEIR